MIDKSLYLQTTENALCHVSFSFPAPYNHESNFTWPRLAGDASHQQSYTQPPKNGLQTWRNGADARLPKGFRLQFNGLCFCLYHRQSIRIAIGPFNSSTTINLVTFDIVCWPYTIAISLFFLFFIPRFPADSLSIGPKLLKKKEQTVFLDSVFFSFAIVRQSVSTLPGRKQDQHRYNSVKAESAAKLVLFEDTRVLRPTSECNGKKTKK